MKGDLPIRLSLARVSRKTSSAREPKSGFLSNSASLRCASSTQSRAFSSSERPSRLSSSFPAKRARAFGSSLRASASRSSILMCPFYTKKDRAKPSFATGESVTPTLTLPPQGGGDIDGPNTLNQGGGEIGSRGLTGRGVARASLLVALHGSVVLRYGDREMMAPVVLRDKVQVLDRRRVQRRLDGLQARVRDRSRRKTELRVSVERRAPSKVLAG